MRNGFKQKKAFFFWKPIQYIIMSKGQYVFTRAIFSKNYAQKLHALQKL